MSTLIKSYQKEMLRMYKDQDPQVKLLSKTIFSIILKDMWSKLIRGHLFLSAFAKFVLSSKSYEGNGENFLT